MLQFTEMWSTDTEPVTLMKYVTKSNAVPLKEKSDNNINGGD